MCRWRSGGVTYRRDFVDTAQWDESARQLTINMQLSPRDIERVCAIPYRLRLLFCRRARIFWRRSASSGIVPRIGPPVLALVD